MKEKPLPIETEFTVVDNYNKTTLNDLFVQEHGLIEGNVILVDGRPAIIKKKKKRKMPWRVKKKIKGKRRKKILRKTMTSDPGTPHVNP